MVRRLKITTSRTAASGKIVPGKQEGEPEIKLKVAGREDYPLANWPGAVAVTVTDRLYCLDGDRWRLEPSANNSTARGFLEKRYCPDRYDLPAVIAPPDIGRNDARLDRRREVCCLSGCSGARSMRNTALFPRFRWRPWRRLRVPPAPQIDPLPPLKPDREVASRSHRRA